MLKYILMKKIFYSLLALILLASPVIAKDKGIVKFSNIKFKSVSGKSGASILATTIGDKIQITVGGTAGTKNISAGTFTVFLDADQIDDLEKGDTLEVSSTGDSVQDGTANVLFLGTKVKIAGFSTKTTGAATNNDSEADGSFKVVKYNSETKELKFTINAKVSPWTQTNSNNSTEVVTKAAKLIAAVVVTLP